ncbi:MAG TPA: hypothetical protein PLT37_00740 [Kiritimatiellia bacterium]|nr:hypothetical protein [Kiritimatiellia bacterium]MBP9571986.1 hypothetical protein [Kiritimatiellia bacterium]HQF19751.1 hypothetical protein [Kiritimatiellia bacterium]HQG73968.1 hypothetical protein [Kiritimatiellia bacterium]
MTLLRTLGLVLPLALLMTGCASTPAKRIEKNQELFDTFPVAAQARIRSGQIDIGFQPDMVRMALGDPQRKQVRRTAAGSTEIWLYMDTLRRYERQRVDIDGISLVGPGGLRSMGGSAWINVAQTLAFIRTRVEFLNGVVSAIEESPPEPPK